MNNEELANQMVNEKMKTIQIQSTREKVALEQDRRNRKRLSRELTFRVGELVRLRFPPAERRLKEGKRIAPYLLRWYNIVRTMRVGWSYHVVPEDEPTERMKT